MSLDLKFNQNTKWECELFLCVLHIHIGETDSEIDLILLFFFFLLYCLFFVHSLLVRLFSDFFLFPFAICRNKGLIVVVFTISIQVIICGFFSARNCVVPTHKYKSCNMNDTFRLPHLLSISKDQDFFFLLPSLCLSLSRLLFRFRFLGVPKTYYTWVRLSDLYKELSKHTNRGRLFAPWPNTSNCCRKELY